MALHIQKSCCSFPSSPVLSQHSSQLPTSSMNHSPTHHTFLNHVYDTHLSSPTLPPHTHTRFSISEYPDLKPPQSTQWTHLWTHIFCPPHICTTFYAVNHPKDTFFNPLLHTYFVPHAYVCPSQNYIAHIHLTHRLLHRTVPYSIYKQEQTTTIKYIYLPTPYNYSYTII